MLCGGLKKEICFHDAGKREKICGLFDVEMVYSTRKQSMEEKA